MSFTYQLYKDLLYNYSTCTRISRDLTNQGTDLGVFPWQFLHPHPRSVDLSQANQQLESGADTRVLRQLYHCLHLSFLKSTVPQVNVCIYLSHLSVITLQTDSDIILLVINTNKRRFFLLYLVVLYFYGVTVISQTHLNASIIV